MIGSFLLKGNNSDIPYNLLSKSLCGIFEA